MVCYQEAVDNEDDAWQKLAQCIFSGLLCPEEGTGRRRGQKLNMGKI